VLGRREQLRDITHARGEDDGTGVHGMVLGKQLGVLLHVGAATRAVDHDRQRFAAPAVVGLEGFDQALREQARAVELTVVRV